MKGRDIKLTYKNVTETITATGNEEINRRLKEGWKMLDIKIIIDEEGFSFPTAVFGKISDVKSDINKLTTSIDSLSTQLYNLLNCGIKMHQE